MKKFAVILAATLMLVAINLGIPVRFRTLNLLDERDRYVIYQTYWA